MSDAGNIDIGSKLGAPKPTGANDKKVINTDSEPSIKSNNKGDLVKKENKSIYKNRSNSQESFNSSNSEANAEETEAKGYKFSAKNPILESKLSNRKIVKANNKKEKKAPPQPSLRVRLSPKGVAVNPRKVKPHVPGRLKSFFDDRIKMIDKLTDAIDIETVDDSKLSLINKHAKKLLGLNREFSNNASIAEMLNIDIDIAKQDPASIIKLLENKAELLAEDQDLQFYVTEIINQMNQPNHVLTSLLQLFMPLPLPFLFAEIDDEFDEDEEELYEDDNENFFSGGDDKNEDEEEDDEHKFDSEASLSIKTINFNKMHFIIKYNKKLNKIKVGIKGDATATELAIPIETNLEDVIEDDVNDIDYLLRLWSDNIMRVTETRILKVRSKGKLEPVILKACNSILNTISESDIDLDEDENISASYKMI